MTIALLLAAAADAKDVSDADELRAILTFRDEHLEVREEQQILPGRVLLLGPGLGWGPGVWGGYTWADPDVISSPPEVLSSWAVYRGPERLTVSAFLDAIDRGTEARALEVRVHRNTTIARVFGGIAVTGLAAGIGGFGGSIADPARETTWTMVAIGGLSSSVLAGVVSGATHTRADTLAHDYDETQDLAETQRDVRTANESLRGRLGLTPAQAYHELDRPPRTLR